MNTYFCIIMALLSCQMWRVLKSLASQINMRHARDCCNAPAIHCRSILHSLCSLPLPLHHCNGAALHHLARQPFAILRDISACRAFRLHLSNATPVHPGHPVCCLLSTVFRGFTFRAHSLQRISAKRSARSSGIFLRLESSCSVCRLQIFRRPQTL